MKKLYLFLTWIMLSTLFLWWITSAANDSLWFNKWWTCENVDKKLNDFLDMAKKKFYVQPRYYLMTNTAVKTVDMVESVAMDDAAINTAWAVEKTSSVAYESWWKVETSSTNLEVAWVDEPEILKIANNKILYWNDAWLHAISTWTSLDDFQLDKFLSLPDWMYWMQMFATKNKIYVLVNRNANWKWNYYSYMTNARTTVLVYRISDYKLLEMYDLWWSFNDARMIWSKLYITTNNNFWYYDFYWLKKSFSFDEDFPKSYWVVVKDWMPTIDKLELDCNNINLILPDEDTLEKNWMDFSFTTITTIDTSKSKNNMTQEIIAWSWLNTHMNNENVYFYSTNYEYKEIEEEYEVEVQEDIICALWDDNCTWWKVTKKVVKPRKYNDYQPYTYIHKFNLTDKWVDYQTSFKTEWRSNWQYSSSEVNWNYVIITSHDTRWNYATWDRIKDSKYTQVTAFDKNWKRVWDLYNIANWEDYKSSRFMWDKLYLVTFEEIDPLFVIDLKDIANMKILWELKIPWYSKYLHPIKSEDWKQRLLWIWYDTADNWYGWIRNNWIKISTFEVDYSNDKVKVYEIDSEVYWENWSSSEAIENPRSFTFNNKTQTLYLPYRLVNQWEKQRTWFMKVQILDDWTFKEIYQHDINTWNDQWYYAYNSRTWYVWDVDFYINNDQAEFVKWNMSKNMKLKKKIYKDYYDDVVYYE